MRLQRLAWAGPMGILLILLVPVSAMGSPLHGVVTTCSSRTSCNFVFNTSAGTGWATTTATQFSFQLPGEAAASYNLSYSTYIGSLTGTYTYWTVGSFLGTDVNTGKVVYGSTDTNYTITCHGHSGRGGGCTYTYTTDNGTVVVHLTQAEQTATAIVCSPTAIHPATKTSCTVSVSNLWNATHFPTGTVHLSSGRLGAFSDKGTCTLANGTCSFTWKAYDSTCGLATLLASYGGTPAFYKSAASTSIDVYVSGGC